MEGYLQQTINFIVRNAEHALDPTYNPAFDFTTTLYLDAQTKEFIEKCSPALQDLFTNIEVFSEQAQSDIQPLMEIMTDSISSFVMQPDVLLQDPTLKALFEGNEKVKFDLVMKTLLGETLHAWFPDIIKTADDELDQNSLQLKLDEQPTLKNFINELMTFKPFIDPHILMSYVLRLRNVPSNDTEHLHALWNQWNARRSALNAGELELPPELAHLRILDNLDEVDIDNQNCRLPFAYTYMQNGLHALYNHPDKMRGSWRMLAAHVGTEIKQAINSNDSFAPRDLYKKPSTGGNGTIGCG
ncbi:hypothetical protein KC726_05805 [Candidatus Woesebacteria bacterium]|nr:hypothetical protein [Candidatus Woesebacteria bacterium]